MAIQGDGGDTIWGKLHSELLILILVRLPVISILRFKSVCRDWYVLFNSPWFAQHHCRIAKSSNEITNLLSLFIHSPQNEGNCGTFSLVRDRSCGEPVLEKLLNPFSGHLDEIRVVGCINGLVCLTLYNSATFIVLWNPATRNLSSIPNHQLLLAAGERISVGFAYDEETDSYKVIRILYSRDRTVRVEVYSTVTNTWRTIVTETFPFLVDQTFGAVVSGSPYWCGYGSNRQPVLMLFDASVEAFRSQWLQLRDAWPKKIRLGAMGENVVASTLMYTSAPGPDGATTTSVGVWTLSKCDDGFIDSFTVENSRMEHISIGLSVAGFRRNGEIIAFDEDAKLFVYGPDSTVKYFPSCGSWVSDRFSPKAYDYTESLVSPSRVD